MITKLIRTTIITLSLIILSEILRYYKVYSTLIQNTESRFINNPIILSATIAIIALLAGSYLWNSKKNVLPNQNLGYIAFSFIGLSIYYFFCIYPFFKSEYFLALFIFLIIIIGIKIIHIINKNKSDKIVEKNDLSDNSIKTPSEDKYEYYISAENLLKRILAAPHYFKDRSLCVGIEASWGHGKTSYLNLIEYSVTVDKESVNYNKAIIIKFNAWMSSSNQQLTENFMATLSEVLTPYNPNITSKIAHYSRTLSNADLGWLSKIVKIVTPPIETSLEKQFEDLSNCIGEIDKPIIVYIDDIDRLFFTEIMGVLKLIRNTASFKNTIFVVPYDRDYVVKQLKQNNISEEYLEKMFNLPYSLPPLNQEKKNLIYKDIICNALSVNEKNKEQVDDFLKAVDEDFTLRTIKRLLNMIQVKRSYLDSIKLGDIFLFDLLIMEYIHFKYNGIYSIIQNKLLESKFDKDITFKTFRNENGKKELDIDLIDKELSNIKKISTDDIEKCKQLLLLVFNKYYNKASNNIISVESTNPYRLKNEELFSAYFNETTHHSESNFITSEEFNKIKDKDSEQFNELIIEWLENKNKDLIKRLFDNIEFKDEKEGLSLLNKSIVYYKKEGLKSFLIIGIDIARKNPSSINYKTLYTFFMDIQNSNIETVNIKTSLLIHEFYKEDPPMYNNIFNKEELKSRYLDRYIDFQSDDINILTKLRELKINYEDLPSELNKRFAVYLKNNPEHFYNYFHDNTVEIDSDILLFISILLNKKTPTTNKDINDLLESFYQSSDINKEIIAKKINKYIENKRKNLEKKIQAA